MINDLNSNAIHANFTLSVDRTLKTLGITWSTNNDKIFYITNPVKNSEKVIKRIILSEIAKIYDPLGLLGPVILYVKRLMQEIWRSGLN